MARVQFMVTQRHHTGGVAEVDLPATDFRAAVSAIRARFPAFPERELTDCTVAIDGRIVNRPWLEALRPDSELRFVARIGAG